MSSGKSGVHRHVKLDNSHPEEGEEGEGPWLMSFADMVTLLMCFFILFFQTEEGNVHLRDPKKVLAQLELLQRILGVDAESSRNAGELIAVPTMAGASGTADDLGQQLKTAAAQFKLVFYVGVPRPGEIELTFEHRRFFRSGQVELTSEARELLRLAVERFKELPRGTSIEVDGHTDADAVSEGRYASNWELSGARAASVVRHLAELGVPRTALSFRGLADTRPVLPETDRAGKPVPENKALNRRIVVRLRQPVPKPAGGAP